MKFLTTILALTSLSALAHGASFQATLNQFDIDPKAKEMIGINDVDYGSVSINYDKQEVSLVLGHRFHCPEGRMCAMFMVKPFIVTLPIQKTTVDECGIPHIIASKDTRMVDGDLETLEVLDNAKSKCRYFVAIPGAAVNFDTLSVRGYSTHSQFSGEGLVKE